MTDTMQWIPVDQIRPGDNDRKTFDPDALEELATSIAKVGLAQPITVRVKLDWQGPEDGFAETRGEDRPAYEIVCGERRWRAHLFLRDRVDERFGEIQAFVMHLTDEETAEVMLVENLARQDLDPIEEALAFRSRMDSYSWTVEDCAMRAGVAPKTVDARLALLDLALDIQKLVADGQLPLGHAGVLSTLDLNRQRIALRVYRESRSMSLAAFRKVVSELRAEQDQEALFDVGSFWTQVDNARTDRGAPWWEDVIPEAADLTEFKVTKADGVGGSIESYLVYLQDHGLDREAEVVGTLLRSMLKSGMAYLSKGGELQQRAALEG